MEFRWDSNHELTGKRLFRFMAKLGTKIKVVFYRIMKSLFYFGDCSALKCYYISLKGGLDIIQQKPYS